MYLKMSVSRGVILAVILVISVDLTSSRRSPCTSREKVTGISTKPIKRCVVPNVKIPYSTLISRSSQLELSWTNGDDINYHDEERYLLQVKPNRRNGRSKTYCIKVYVQKGDKLHKNIQLNCLKKFLGKNGKIVIVKESNSKRQPATVVKMIKYKFTRKKAKKLPTKLSAPTCYTWKPDNVRAVISGGGVNITACPRNISLGRMEFGLYNIKLDAMEPNFLTPQGCWAFFPDLSEGDYTGTVQLRGCTDCDMYTYTRSPCSTTRHQSAQFSIIKPTTTLLPSTTTLNTCSTWRPRAVRRFMVDGGVNVTSCPRDSRLGRLEFGLYNVNLEQMGKYFQTPEECWAFFPNISHGVYEGTVQLRDCKDCLMYSYTKMPCSTTRFHSPQFSLVNQDEPEELITMPLTLHSHKLAPLPTNHTTIIVASSCTALTLLLLVFVFVYFRFRGKKCDDKESKEDQYRFLNPNGILVSPTKNNKILVLYQADGNDHLNAVHSFCKILRLCNADVVMDREQVSKISEQNKDGWTRRQISECSAVVVVLSRGLLEKCQEMRRKTPPILESKFKSDAFDDPFFNMSALGLACMQNVAAFKKKTVIFVSFGYGMDVAKDLSHMFPSMVKKIHSVTNEPDVSPFYKNRTKRALNLQTLEPYLFMEHSASMEAVSRSEAANEFLFHVGKVMHRPEDVIII